MNFEKRYKQLKKKADKIYNDLDFLNKWEKWVKLRDRIFEHENFLNDNPSKKEILERRNFLKRCVLNLSQGTDQEREPESSLERMNELNFVLGKDEVELEKLKQGE